MERIIHEGDLAAEIRAICDKAKRRIWLAVPFIGSVHTVRSLLGRVWLDRDDVELRLLVDIEERSCLDLRSLRVFAERGKVRSVPWLHAKVYMADDAAVVTSANLTDTAFSKRVEVGVRLGVDETAQLAAVYDVWWKMASPKELDEILRLQPIPSTRAGVHADDHGRASPRRLWSLPKDPGGGEEHAGGEFRDLNVFLDYYNDLASKYEATQRLWPDVPLWFETDNFLNYLLHECWGKPAQKYMKRPARRFGSEQVRTQEIEKYCHKFKVDPGRGPVGDWVHGKVAHSRLVQRMLSESHLEQLTRDEVAEVIGGFNCFQSLALNRVRFLNPQNNELSTIRDAWRDLLYGPGAVSARMERCHQRLRWFGKSSIQELLGYFVPEKYPLRNRETDAVLRFFGYPVSVRS